MEDRGPGIHEEWGIRRNTRSEGATPVEPIWRLAWRLGREGPKSDPRSSSLGEAEAAHTWRYIDLA